ncbi:MAG: hypothetical protein U0223_06265 [Nitrospira sp.]|nr:hypothetical protein [Nitrospira sp.]
MLTVRGTWPVWATIWVSIGWAGYLSLVASVTSAATPRIDRRLAVVPLDDTPLGPGIRHEPALRVGEVALGLRMGHRAGGLRRSASTWAVCLVRLADRLCAKKVSG